MKKFAATFCIAGTALALSACETTGTNTGNVDTAPPYANERTAGYDSEPAPVQRAPAERVFREYQTK